MILLLVVLIDGLVWLLIIGMALTALTALLPVLLLCAVLALLRHAITGGRR